MWTDAKSNQKWVCQVRGAVKIFTESKRNKARKVAKCATLSCLSLVERADVDGAGLVAIWDPNVALMNDRNSLVYQSGALQQRKAERQWSSCSFGRTRHISANPRPS